MSQEKRPVKLAVPKGSLQKTTADFLARAGIPLQDYGENTRSYRPKSGIEGVEVKVLRPQEIPILLSRGYYDLGFSGLDWYYESRCERNVEDLVDCGFGKVDIVLAVPDAWADVNSVEDLFKRFRGSTSKNPLRIWTEYLNLADEFVFKYEGTEATVVSPYAGIHRERHAGIEIFHSFGATESKPPEDGDAIIDNTETGRTLRANGLKIIHKVLAGSTAQLLANRRSLLDRDKEERIEQIRVACQKAAPQVTERRRTRYGHIDW
jgi:ATP phosphoribosyltransferase